MRRKYEKPQVTEVRLTSDEVILAGCKREQAPGPGYPAGTGYKIACGWEFCDPCYTYSATPYS